MSHNILVMGDSGTGKSTSIKNLDSKQTFIINVLDKPLPFRGAKSSYIRVSGKSGNYFSCDDASRIRDVINYINKSKPEIKNVIIDDFQYIMANEFMRRAKERGFDKFTEIAQNAWGIIRLCSSLRDDLCFFFLSHTETGNDGKVKCKTIGKMLDEKITLEGMFTIVLHSLVVDQKYKFLTQNDGCHIAKSPLGLFEDQYIDNDLLDVKNKIVDYFEIEENIDTKIDKPIINQNILHA